MVKRSTRTKAVKELEVRPRAAQNATVRLEPLVAVLEGWFDKNLADLPTDKQRRVQRDFPHPEISDQGNAKWRRHTAQQRDNDLASAREQERQCAWDLTKEVRELEAMRAQTPLEFESKKRQLANLRNQLEALGAKIEATDLQRASVTQSTPERESEFNKEDASIDHDEPRASETRTHKLRHTRTHALDAVIASAKKTALDDSDYHSVWAALVTLAESNDRPAPLLEHKQIEVDGIKYQAEKGVKFFTKNALRSMMRRAAATAR